MEQKQKIFLVKIVRLAAILAFLLIVFFIISHFLQYEKFNPEVDSQLKEIPAKTLSTIEKPFHVEYKGERGKLEAKADRCQTDEQGLTVLEGNVEVVDYGRTGSSEIFIHGNKVSYDKDLLHFYIFGQGKIKYQKIQLESEFFEYDKTEQVLRGNKGLLFISPQLKASGQKFIFHQAREELHLEENVKLELNPSPEEKVPSLFVEAQEFLYKKKELKGYLAGDEEGAMDIQFSYGKNRGSAEQIEFTLSTDGEHLHSLRLRGKVRASLEKETQKKSEPQPSSSLFLDDEKQEIVADEIGIRAFLNQPKIHAVEARGNVILNSFSVNGRSTQTQGESLDLIFNRDQKLREFRILKDAKITQTASDLQMIKTIEGKEMVLAGKREILHVRGSEEKPARISSEGREFEAQDITLSFQNENLEASGFCRFHFLREGSLQDSLAFFSAESPFFIASEAMRYDHELKRYEFYGQVRMWQGKNVLQADRVILWKDRREISCEVKVKTIFFQAPDEGKAEEKVEIGAEKMAFIPEKNMIFYEKGAFLRTRDVFLQAQSISVSLEEKTPKALWILAQGDVSLIQGTREVRGGESRYHLKEGTVVFTGKPFLMDKDKGMIKGDKLTFYLDDGRILIENTVGERSITIVKS